MLQYEFIYVFISLYIDAKHRFEECEIFTYLNVSLYISMANWCRNGVNILQKRVRCIYTHKRFFGHLHKSIISYRNIIDCGLILVPKYKGQQ